MQKWLLIFFLLCFQSAFAQRGILYIKKHGYKKVRSYAEGESISLRVKDGTHIEGYIDLIRNDSVFINGSGYHQNEIIEIIIRKNDWKGLGKQTLITTAAATAIVGVLYASGKNKEDPAIIPKMAIIGYTPIIYRLFGFLRRTHYRIGKKFSVQTLDLHFTGKPI
jgi:hypothetical protein